MGRANVYSLFFAIPAAVLLTGGYVLIWGKTGIFEAQSVISQNLFLAVIIVIMGILMHELIHGLSWAWFGKKPLSVIRYGFNLKALTPYAHCKEPMKISTYRLGAVMPGLILGILPSAIGIISGQGEIMIFGLLFTVAAGGDVMVLWLVRKEKSGVLVMDHTTQAGCYVMDVDKN
jgi:hypothetical protein